MSRLKNKIVLVTGASSGIGKACAEQFAEQGASLLLCARRVEKIHEFAGYLKKNYGTESHVFYLDVTQYSLVKKTLASLPITYAMIDILVNNAGLALGLESLAEGEIIDWEIMLDTNVKGLLYITKEVLPSMIKRNSGHIINIGSIAGHCVYPKGVVYCASKSAVRALSQGLRMDLLGTKIRVSSIDPGAVATDFSLVRFKGDKKKAKAVYKNIEALTAADVADAVIYCATRRPEVNIDEILIMPTDQIAMTTFAFSS